MGRSYETRSTRIGMVKERESAASKTLGTKIEKEDSGGGAGRTKCVNPAEPSANAMRPTVHINGEGMDGDPCWPRAITRPTAMLTTGTTKYHSVVSRTPNIVNKNVPTIRKAIEITADSTTNVDQRPCSDEYRTTIHPGIRNAPTIANVARTGVNNVPVGIRAATTSEPKPIIANAVRLKTLSRLTILPFVKLRMWHLRHAAFTKSNVSQFDVIPETRSTHSIHRVVLRDKFRSQPREAPVAINVFRGNDCVI